MGTKLINIYIKQTTDQDHNNNNNTVLAKSQQTNGKMRKISPKLATHNGEKRYCVPTSVYMYELTK